MGKVKSAVFVGSLRKDSSNGRLARVVAKLVPEGFEFRPAGNLPL